MSFSNIRLGWWDLGLEDDITKVMYYTIAYGNHFKSISMRD